MRSAALLLAPLALAACDPSSPDEAIDGADVEVGTRIWNQVPWPTTDNPPWDCVIGPADASDASPSDDWGGRSERGQPAPWLGHWYSSDGDIEVRLNPNPDPFDTRFQVEVSMVEWHTGKSIGLRRAPMQLQPLVGPRGAAMPYDAERHSEPMPRGTAYWSEGITRAEDPDCGTLRSDDSDPDAYVVPLTYPGEEFIVVVPYGEFTPEAPSSRSPTVRRLRYVRYAGRIAAEDRMLHRVP